MKIFNQLGYKVLDIEVDDNSYRHRVIMGEHSLTLYFSLPEHVEIPVGSYCEFQGETFTLERPEALKMKHSRLFEYTVTMEAPEAKAKIWKFRNTVDGRLKFSLTAKPIEHLQMFVDNMNRRDKGWTVGDCIDGVEQCINYDHAFCLDALKQQASEFKTEYEFKGKRVSLKKVEYNKNTPLPLSYGRGNGFKSGVGRTNTGDTPPVEILYVQGGSDNLDPSKYGASELRLPKGKQLGYDGEHFDTEDGFNKAASRLYITDEDGLSIRRYDKQLSSLAEDSLDCSSICPKRVGVVSKVITVDKENNFYDFTDTTIPESLNFEDCLIEGETMTVIFQSGMLAGREFEVKYYHQKKTVRGVEKEARRFELVPQELDGQTMPNETFKPREGDKYAVFKCMMPDAYICDDETKTGASWDMFREAVKYIFDNEDTKFTFTGELDGIWAKKDWLNIGGRIVLGGFILFTDPRFQPDGVLVRITGIKDYINKPYSPVIELSNTTVSGGVSSTLKELQSQEVLIEDNQRAALQFTKRRFRDARETIAMLEASLLDNFTGSISPIAVQTMSLLVGDESLQFRFVSSRTNPVQVAHAITWDNEQKQLTADAGIIQHMTLGISSLSSSHDTSEYRFWDVENYISGRIEESEKKFYLYAKVSETGQTGSFLLSETAIKMGQVSGFYHLLVGVLNSEYDGERSFVTLYGFTEVLPGRVTTDRVVSGDGQSYFDMIANALKLGNKLSFNTQGDGLLRLRGTLVQNDGGDESYIGCYRGIWNAAYVYYNGDEVTYTANGLTSTYRYVYATPSKGVVPTNTTYWQILAEGQKGDKGDKGDKGEDGADGIDGLSPNTAYKSTVFKRSNTTPATPTGGSYANPVPTGWSDGVPSGEEKLWASTRIFSSDGLDPQQASWTTPRQMTDTADFDVEFSSVDNPSAPSGHPNTNSQWTNTASASTIWMATAVKSNGVWGTWQISRIKGEKGEDGTSIKIKGTVSSVSDLPNPPADPSDCYIVGQDLYVWNGAGWHNAGQFKGDKGENGADGLNGVNAYVHIKYAKSLTTNDWSDNNGETPDKYIGIYCDSLPTDSMIWSKYSWSKWKGDDGFGYEYIYKRTMTNSAPSTPTIASQNDNYVPSTWTDNPSGVSAKYKYEWLCYRKKVDGVWGKFIGSAANTAVAALWAKFGTDGADGSDGSDGADAPYYEIRYAKNGSTTTAPSLTQTALDPSGWSTTQPSVSTGYYLWMTIAKKSADGSTLIEQWSTPIRITPYDGTDGKDGKSYAPVMVYRGVYSASKTYYGNANRLDCVKSDDTYYIARIDAGTFSNVAPPNTNKWNSFGASFESVATNLLLAENANIGDWFMSGGKIVSTVSSGDIIELDAKNNRICIKSAKSGGDYAVETGLGSQIELNAATGIIEARSKGSTSSVSYMSSSGIFANRAGTRCVSATTGCDQRAAICALGFGNLAKNEIIDTGDTNLIAGVYGYASNSSTAAAYGGYFYNLKANGLILGIKKILGTTTKTTYLTDAQTLVVGLSSVKQTVYMPASDKQGQTIILKQLWTGYMRVYPRYGYKLFDDSTENEYYDVGQGQCLIAHFVKTSINGEDVSVWTLSRFKF